VATKFSANFVKKIANALVVLTITPAAALWSLSLSAPSEATDFILLK
jgi:hypothetical protein